MYCTVLYCIVLYWTYHTLLYVTKTGRCGKQTTIFNAQEKCYTAQAFLSPPFGLRALLKGNRSQRRGEGGRECGGGEKSNHYPAQLTNGLASRSSPDILLFMHLWSAWTHQASSFKGPENLCGGSRVINLRYLPGFTICLQNARNLSSLFSITTYVS